MMENVVIIPTESQLIHEQHLLGVIFRSGKKISDIKAAHYNKDIVFVITSEQTIIMDGDIIQIHGSDWVILSCRRDKFNIFTATVKTQTEINLMTYQS